jgi:glycine cleavage system H protein
MQAPQDLLYTPSHEWVRIEGDTAVIGITAFAQEQLGDITYVDLPVAGATLARGAEMGSIESVKAASELYSPVNGTVLTVNTELDSKPELVNEDPFGRGWMVKVRLAGTPSGLLDAAAYAEETARQH